MAEPYEFRGMVARVEMIAALERYVQMRLPLGGFLTALLANDLKEACGRADNDNLHNLPALVAYCYNHIPAHAWGSYERVAAWLTPQIYDHEYDVMVNGLKRTAKRSDTFDYEHLLFTDCTHPEQNCLCLESDVEAYRERNP